MADYICKWTRCKECLLWKLLWGRSRSSSKAILGLDNVFLWSSAAHRGSTWSRGTRSNRTLWSRKFLTVGRDKSYTYVGSVDKILLYTQFGLPLFGASLHLYKSVRLFVGPSVRTSVGPFVRTSLDPSIRPPIRDAFSKFRETLVFNFFDQQRVLGRCRVNRGEEMGCCWGGGTHLRFGYPTCRFDSHLMIWFAMCYERVCVDLGWKLASVLTPFCARKWISSIGNRAEHSAYDAASRRLREGVTDLRDGRTVGRTNPLKKMWR